MDVYEVFGPRLASCFPSNSAEALIEKFFGERLQWLK